VAVSAWGWLRALGCAAAVLTGSAALPAAQNTPQAPTATPEYQLKAVFLFNFAQFVSWPAEAFADSAAPLVIGVLGTDPFGAYLDETVRGEVVEGHPLVVRRFSDLAGIGDCHILFVSQDEVTDLPALLRAIEGRSVLTVSDVEGFAASGGMIRFVNDRNRIRLRINLEAARAAHLTLSSKLLRPAEIVRQGQD
jgi:YfiR/HmsC-like